MARCNCNSLTCSCVLRAGDGVTLTGAGTAQDPWVIGAEGGGGTSGWSAGDQKTTYRSDTPAGWLECNGQAVSRSTYAALFTAVGTRFGSGDGVNTFNLPNETGRVSVGAGPGYPQDQTGGTASTTLLTGNLPPHTHTINHDHPSANTSSAGAHDHELARNSDPGSTFNIPQGGSGSVLSDAAIGDAGAHIHTVDIPAFTGDSGSTGGGLAFTNLPPYRANRVLIKT